MWFCYKFGAIKIFFYKPNKLIDVRNAGNAVRAQPIFRTNIKFSSWRVKRHEATAVDEDVEALM